MNAKNINEILDALAARLSVPASHLWGVLVNQARVEFWENAVVVLIFGAVAVTLSTLWVRHLKEWAEKDCEAVITIVAVVGLVSIITTVISVGFLIGKIGYLVNPEYYALTAVLGALK